MTWTGVHCRLSWQPSDVDAFVAGTLAPLAQRYGKSGLITGWYYLRYWETGPHLRVRVRDAAPETVEKLVVELRDLIADAAFPVQEGDPETYYAGLGVSGLPWYPHGDVRQAPYEPETGRYGGPDALPVAEEIFQRSTEIAVAVLRATPSPSARLTAGIELAIATATALDLDRPAAAAWLRAMAAGWRVAQEPSPAPSLSAHAAAHQLLATRGRDLAQRWRREPRGATRYWIDAIRAARSELPHPMPHVWASQLHMLFNRLGIGPHEERTICWLVAATALSPDGLTPFHEDGETAPDRRYVEAAKFLPGFADQLPKTDAPAPGSWSAPWHRTVELPAPAPVTASLTDALRARRSSHDLTGSLTADRLAGLLWTAQSGHPYPSAGAKYCARLRLVALSVGGLEPGVYEVNEADRTLTNLGAAPSTVDLEATSMWFGPGATLLAGTPAVLALYVQLGRLRRTYGMRALRFAYAEAGHLAQNLTLVAAALGVRTGLIGGFYDDLAHDVLGLDGVNDTLVYLLPLAGQAMPEAESGS